MASELLRAKRRVSLTVAQKISAAWGIPYASDEDRLAG